MSDEIDTKANLAIYRIIAETGTVPTSAEVAKNRSMSVKKMFLAHLDV
jgi:hypothetical protein